MKEILKNKMMMAFVIFVFGALYLNSLNINNEMKQAENENKVVAYNR